MEEVQSKLNCPSLSLKHWCEVPSPSKTRLHLQWSLGDMCCNWSSIYWWTGEEREEEPKGEFLINISPPEATNWSPPCTPPNEEHTLQDRPKLTTRTSVATEGAHPGEPPRNEPFQGRHVAQQLLPNLYKNTWEKKESVCQILKSDNPRGHQKKPFLRWCLSVSQDTEPCWKTRGLTAPCWWQHPGLNRTDRAVHDVERKRAIDCYH